MCGIHVSISAQSALTPSDDLKELLCKRGPDFTGEAAARSDRHGIPYYLSFTSTVLALRGDHVTSQPFVDPQTGSVFCWNGEAWRFGAEPINGNDGQAIFDALLRTVSNNASETQSTDEVLGILKSISGPFAFVFYCQPHQQIYFGRDRLGRRSLLYNVNPDSVEFSSVGDPSRGIWKEVEADAIYILPSSYGAPYLDSSLDLWSLLPLIKYDWDVKGSPLKRTLGNFNRDVPSEEQNLTSGAKSVNLLHYYLCESLKSRILNIPVPLLSSNIHNTRIAILFSGGVDCTVLARIAHDMLPSDYQIDLLNVAFENPRVIQAAKNASNPKEQVNKIFQNINQEDERTRLAHEEKDPTDNLAYETCPDRQTGRKSFQELKKVCSSRFWRFVAINIPYRETMAHRTKVVELIHPHNTEMDLSIALALYFASRGTGIASSNTEQESLYTTPARVLLSGLGADELFGGYTRHAVTFNRKGYAALFNEMELDINRLGKRNLGRDDRVISHWGREARYPYLDESLVRWAVESPIWDKCGFQTVPFPADELNLEIEPGKKILRLLAYDMGMCFVACEKKRAIQFGSRTAKMEIGRIKGTSIIK